MQILCSSNDSKLTTHYLRYPAAPLPNFLLCVLSNLAKVQYPRRIRTHQLHKVVTQVIVIVLEIIKLIIVTALLYLYVKIESF